MDQMFMFCLRINDDVIKVCDGIFTTDSFKYICHQFLKYARSVAQAKWHHIKFIIFILWQAKAVLLRSLGSNSTCQYPDLRSKQVKCFFLPIDANISSICGSGQTYDFVILFNFRKSTQNRFDPSDFSIRTTGNDHSEWLGLIMLFFNISFTASSMTRLWFMAVRYGRNLMGGLLPVSIFILTALVLPKSLSVSANKSLFRLIKCCNWFWYSGGAVICPTSNTASSPPPVTVDSESTDSRYSLPPSCLRLAVSDWYSPPPVFGPG